MNKNEKYEMLANESFVSLFIWFRICVRHSNWADALLDFTFVVFLFSFAYNFIQSFLDVSWFSIIETLTTNNVFYH